MEAANKHQTQHARKIMVSVQDTVDALAKESPGQIPLEIFNEIARLTVVPVVEVIMISQGKIFLLKRPTDDKYWPDQYCLPGKILSPSGHSSIEDYITEICHRFGVPDGDKAHFSGAKLYKTKRGTELAVVYQVEAQDPNDLKNKGSLIAIRDLEEINVISEHVDIIATFIQHKSV